LQANPLMKTYPPLFINAAAVVGAVLLLPGVAHAQFVRAIHLDDPVTNKRVSSDAERDRFFNQARCECGKTIKVTIEINRNSSSSDSYWVMAGGDDCITTENEPNTDKCTLIHGPHLIAEEEVDIEFTTTATALMNGECGTSTTIGLGVLVGQVSGDVARESIELKYEVDGDAPEKPIKGDDPTGGENLVEVDFETGSTSQANVEYQILCERQEGDSWVPGLDNPPTAQYVTPGSACVDDTPIADGGTADAGVSDSGVSDSGAADSAEADSATIADSAPATAGAASLDPAYVCSEALSSDGAHSIKGLADGVTYRLYVVAFDLHGNPSEAVLLGEATPALSEDLWERYKRSGGQTTGDYCQLARGGGGWCLLLLGLALALLASRRRRRGVRR